ncbi:MAG: GldG family protein [Deltaproteobacteria bacterium]|nr:GldG family protein [Candidatus Anaeroferrophillus wilburensis]MBN2888396.1 GldG family protein [Deltaproteobacteria bacterium]
MDMKRRYGVNAFIALLALAGILVFVNLISQRYYQRYDLSDGQIYTVPSYTRELLASLEDPLQVKVYFSTELPFPYSDYRRYIAEKLEEYQVFTGSRLRYEFVDPDLDPELKKQMQMIGIPQIQLTDVSSNKLEVKNCYLGMAFYYQDKNEVIPYVQKTEDLDYKFTSLMKKLTAERQPRVAIASGNIPRARRELSQLIQALEQQHTVEFLDLAEEKTLGEPADALVVLAPEKKLTPWQLLLIDRYVMAGKGVAFFASPLETNLQVMAAWRNQENNLNDLLQAYGVRINTDLLMDARNERITVQSRQGQFMVSNLVNYPLFPSLVDVNHDQVMVSDFQNLHFPFVSTVEQVDGAAGEFTWLVRSSAQSKLQTKEFSIDPYTQPDVSGFHEGPYVVAAAVTGELKSYFADRPLPVAPPAGKEESAVAEEDLKTVETAKAKTAPEELQKNLVAATGQGRILVVGCSSFMKDDYLDGLMASFFFNAVDWLLQDQGLIGIRSRGLGSRPLTEIDPLWQQMVAYANILLVPLLLIIIGLIRWRWRWQRIKRRVERLLQ